MKKVTILFFLASISFQPKAQNQAKPNVLLIYTDDHRYTGVHALGKQPVQTPYLDQLVEEGIAFTNTYLMGSFSGATCIPSRAMLLTGRDLFSIQGMGHTIPESHTMLGEAFMDAGYHAHHIGKWHQDFKSLARSFNSGGKVAGKPRYLVDQYRMPFTDWQADGNYTEDHGYLLEYDDQGAIKRRPLTKDDQRGPIGTEETGPHVSEVLADEAIHFLKKHHEKQPFFMYLAFPTPHDPRQAPQKYYDMYPVEELELPPSYMPQHPFDNGHIVLRDELLAPWPRTPQIAKKHLSEYYAIISHLDAQIGKVVMTLKENDLYQNTLIIMAGDSGLGVGNHGLLGKQNIYDEDGVHIPFILSGGLVSRQDHGRRIHALSYIHDIMPTLCELVGIPVPKTVIGKSLAPVIRGEIDQIRDYTFHAYRQHQRAFRMGDYKLIEYVRAPDSHRDRGDFIAGSRVTQLFNVSEDPWETLNLADFPEYQAKVFAMRKEMILEAIKLGDHDDGLRTSVNFWDYWSE